MLHRRLGFRRLVLDRLQQGRGLGRVPCSATGSCGYCEPPPASAASFIQF
jgi:hypothetical protein